MMGIEQKKMNATPQPHAVIKEKAKAIAYFTMKTNYVKADAYNTLGGETEKNINYLERVRVCFKWILNHTSSYLAG